MHATYDDPSDGHYADDDSRQQTMNEDTSTPLSSTAPAGLVNLPRPDGLTTAEVVALLQNPSDSTVLPRIPTGTKNDVYMPVSNQRNVDRHRHGQPKVFDDDCGVWDKKTARYNKYPYLQLEGVEGGLLKRVFWNAGMNKYLSLIHI